MYGRLTGNVHYGCPQASGRTGYYSPGAMKNKAKQTITNLSLAKLTKNYDETPQADILAVIIWI
jgi:hypothetical protein